MRTIALPYGDTTVQVGLPDSLEVEVAAPPDADAGPGADACEGPTDAPMNEAGIVEGALDAPVGSRRLEERARGLARCQIAARPCMASPTPPASSASRVG